METPHTTTADMLIARFASLVMAVLLKKDWLNIPALTMALSDALIAIENLRIECGQAVTFTGVVYSSPYLPHDFRFEQFSTILNEIADQFGQRVDSIGTLALESIGGNKELVRQTPAPVPFRTDADLIAYARHLQAEAIEGIRLLRLAAKIVDAQGRGQFKGVLLDIIA